MFKKPALRAEVEKIFVIFFSQLKRKSSGSKILPVKENLVDKTVTHKHTVM